MYAVTGDWGPMLAWRQSASNRLPLLSVRFSTAGSSNSPTRQGHLETCSPSHNSTTPRCSLALRCCAVCRTRHPVRLPLVQGVPCRGADGPLPTRLHLHAAAASTLTVTTKNGPCPATSFSPPFPPPLPLPVPPLPPFSLAPLSSPTLPPLSPPSLLPRSVLTGRHRLSLSLGFCNRLARWPPFPPPSLCRARVIWARSAYRGHHQLFDLLGSALSRALIRFSSCNAQHAHSTCILYRSCSHHLHGGKRSTALLPVLAPLLLTTASAVRLHLLDDRPFGAALTTPLAQQYHC